MPDNRIDKPRLDPPTLLINSSATWLSAHAQKISRHVSMVTAATRMRILGTRPFSELFNLIKKKTAKPDNRGSTVIALCYVALAPPRRHQHPRCFHSFYMIINFVLLYRYPCSMNNIRSPFTFLL